MKTKRRLASLLLAMCLALGLMPTAAFATETNTSAGAGADTGRAIQLGTSGISGWDGADGYDYLYFGNWEAQDEHTTTGPIKWRVLDDQTNTRGDGLFLLSDALLGAGKNGGVCFQETYHEYGDDNIVHQGSEPSDGDHTKCQLANVWQGSDAQGWCESFFANSLTSQEQGAVLPTTKSDEAFTSSSDTYGIDSFAASEGILNGDKVFFLSAEEAENEGYGFADDAARIADYGSGTSMWWLRSPHADYTYVAGAISYGGGVASWPTPGDWTPDGWAARPALNLNLDSILFTSAALGGKADAAVDGDLVATGSAGTKWKLTLLDTSRNGFSADANGKTSVSATAGGTVQIGYSGAQTGGNEYVSVLLCDENDKVLYYGNIAQGSANGTADVAIPSGIAAGSYTLKVFSEQCNGDYKTDYASAFEEIELKVSDSPQAPADSTNLDEPDDAVPPARETKFDDTTGGAIPHTGDANNIVLLIAAVLAVGAGLIAVLAGAAIRAQKRNFNR